MTHHKDLFDADGCDAEAWRGAHPVFFTHDIKALLKAPATQANFERMRAVLAQCLDKLERMETYVSEMEHRERHEKLDKEDFEQRLVQARYSIDRLASLSSRIQADVESFNKAVKEERERHGTPPKESR